MAAPLAFVNLIYSGEILSGAASARDIDASMIAPSNFLAAFIAWNSTTVTLNSLTDGQSNTWTIIGTITGGNARAALAVCYAPKQLVAGRDKITYTFSSSVSYCVQVAEFVGVKATGTNTDGNSTNTGTGSNPAYTSNAVATANANDLLLGLYFQGGSSTLTITPGNSFTAVGARVQATGAMQGHYRVVSATGSYANSGTTTTSGSIQWGAGVWAFKQSDTSAPQVSAESVEIASSSPAIRVSHVAAQVAYGGTRSAVSALGAEVSYGSSRGAVTFVAAEVAFVPPISARRPPIIVA